MCLLVNEAKRKYLMSYGAEIRAMAMTEASDLEAFKAKFLRWIYGRLLTRKVICINSINATPPKEKRLKHIWL